MIKEKIDELIMDIRIAGCVCSAIVLTSEQHAAFSKEVLELFPHMQQELSPNAFLKKYKTIPIYITDAYPPYTVEDFYVCAGIENENQNECIIFGMKYSSKESLIHI